MNAVESVVQAVLYEGYMLYPYRPTSVKNRQRWTFGGVYPRAYAEASGSDPWVTQSECLLRGGEHTRVGVRPGFLQVIERMVLDVSVLPAEVPYDTDKLEETLKRRRFAATARTPSSSRRTAST